MKNPFSVALTSAALLWLSVLPGMGQDPSPPLLNINSQASVPSLAKKSMAKVNSPSLGEILILAVEDPLSGVELWRSNGTAAGTQLIRDLVPGSAGSFPQHLTTVGNRVFFGAKNAAGQHTLWVTDGGTATTVLLKTFTTTEGPAKLNAFNGRLIFEGYDADNGRELWESDGTPAGTKLNLAIRPSSLPAQVDHFYNHNNTVLYFTANDGTRGRELWKMNANFQTTIYQDFIEGLGSLFPGNSGTEESPGFFNDFTAMNGMFYFIGVGDEGAELWSTDGNGNTGLVKDVNTGPETSSIRSLRVMAPADNLTKQFLYFSATDGDTTGNGQELFRADGVRGVDGTLTRIKDLAAGVPGSNPDKLTVVGNTLFFTAKVANGVELYRSNGTTTAAATDIVADLNSGAGDSNPSNMTPFGTRLVFTATNTGGNNVVYSATTSGGATTLRSFPAGTVISHFTALGAKMYFLANGELWSTDGVAAAQTTFVKSFQEGDAGSMATGFAKTDNNEVYFSATDGLVGQELWKTDGTPVGTVLVKDIQTGAASSSPLNITPAGPNVYFTADSGSSNRELWFSNGTEPGTQMVKLPGDIEINTGGASDPTNLAYINGELYFSAKGTTVGREPWKTGVDGTVLLGNLDAGGDSDPSQFTSFKNSVYFVAKSAEGVRLRNASNPSVVIEEPGPNNGPMAPTDIIVFGTGANQRMYFAAEIGQKGRELWKSDGTNNGTECIDINTGTGHSNPAHLTAAGNAFYFVASDGAISKTGRELWRSTGSQSTTKLVKDILPGTDTNGNPLSSNPEDLTESGGKLFFTAETAAGRELWVSNGTAAGTLMLKDIVAGPGSAGITEMRDVDGILVFSADDGINGREVWISDGTAAGTKMLEDMAPLSASSNPSGFISLKGELLYAASTATTGNEPHLAPIGSNIELRQPEDTKILAGSNVNFGTVAFKSNTTVTLFIKNIGRNTLKDIKPLISGVNASEFTLVAPKALATVAPAGGTTMAVKFTPKEGGPRSATLSIYSNDGDENPFILNLIGNGDKDPLITTQPVSLMLKTGQQAVFNSGASGTAPLALQWKKGSANIVGATSQSLTLNSVTIKDGAAYSLFVKGNPLTALSNPAELGIVEDNTPPLLVVAGKDKVATLKVNASGNKLTYRWLRQKAGELAASELTDDLRVSGSTSKTLVIKLLETDDTALYTCRVTNPGNSQIGGSTQLNVFGEKPDVLDIQNMPNSIIGGEYSHQILIDPSPLKAALTYSAKNLPAGLKLDAKTGKITGRPTKEGIYNNVLITATNTFGADVSLPQTIDIDAFPSGVEGIYAGTVAHDGEINGHLGGRLDLTITKTGSYSGTLLLGSTRLSLKGAVNVFREELATLPKAELILKRTGKPAPEDVKLTFEINPVTGLLTANSKVTTSGDTALIDGWRRLDATAAANYIGYYTFGMELGDVAQATEAFAGKIPQGWSYGSFTVAKDGKLSFTGRTADGDKITGASFVGINGKIVFFQTLYTPLKGSLVGSLTVDAVNTAEANDNTLTGDVKWARPADVKSKTRTYVAGFGMPDTPVEDPVELEATGSIYVKPVGTALALDLAAPATLDLEFRFGGLADADAIARLDGTVTVAASHKITQPAPNPGQTKLASITGATGAFTGSFALTDADLRAGFTKDLIRKVTYQGIMVKDHLGAKFGAGFFLLPERPEGTETPAIVPIQGGKVELLPVVAP